MECNNCSIRSSSQWRKGPQCKPVLCNPCGVKWKRHNVWNNRNNRTFITKSLIKPQASKIFGNKFYINLVNELVKLKNN